VTVVSELSLVPDSPSVTVFGHADYCGQTVTRGRFTSRATRTGTRRPTDPIPRGACQPSTAHDRP
jgi:hypothetical protein